MNPYSVFYLIQSLGFSPYPPSKLAMQTEAARKMRNATKLVVLSTGLVLSKYRITLRYKQVNFYSNPIPSQINEQVGLLTVAVVGDHNVIDGRPFVSFSSLRNLQHSVSFLVNSD